MKKSIGLYYANMPNMGDLLNVLIVRDLFGFEVKRKTVLNCEMAAIGSGLQNFTWSKNIKLRILQELYKNNKTNVYIWGTGFMYDSIQDREFFRKNITFNSVRGNLSKSRVEKILNKELDIPTGDAGLLASYLVKKPKEKKYSVGIIPHFREQDLPSFKEMHNKYNNSIVINLRDEPIEVIKQISQCEVIISSSLHGLIVADSFNIPNQYIIASDNRLRGDGFKFRDYYSSFDIDASPIDISKEEMPTIDQILEQYKITEKMVDLKKEEIISSFPFR